MTLGFNYYLLLLGKTLFVFASVLYFVFALVIVKQVSMMTKNVADKFNFILLSFSYLHLLFSIFLILLTLIVL